MLANLTIPVLNRYDLLQRCLYSIDYPVASLMIIDNGGEIQSLEVPDKVKKVSILSMPSNLGVASSWNLGIKAYAESPVFFFSSADTEYQPGALETLATASPEEITLADSFPYWQTFGIGSDVVRKIGLFDESFYPIYFEDTDYVRRAEMAEIKVVKKDLPLRHDNSSTIKSNVDYERSNKTTFQSNSKYFAAKTAAGDFGEGRWDLDRRRDNSWGV